MVTGRFCARGAGLAVVVPAPLVASGGDTTVVEVLPPPVDDGNRESVALDVGVSVLRVPVEPHAASSTAAEASAASPVAARGGAIAPLGWC